MIPCHASFVVHSDICVWGVCLNEPCSPSIALSLIVQTVDLIRLRAFLIPNSQPLGPSAKHMKVETSSCHEQEQLCFATRFDKNTQKTVL